MVWTCAEESQRCSRAWCVRTQPAGRRRRSKKRLVDVVGGEGHAGGWWCGVIEESAVDKVS